MASLASIMRYLRLKILISVFRLMIRFAESPTRPRPDAILQMPSRDKHRSIRVHVYNPVEESAKLQQPTPVLVNLNGSAFVLRLHGSDDQFCRRVATNAGYIVFDVEYRLAPEHPLPAAVNDVEDAIKYVLALPDRYDTSAISVSGFSSGGTLALVAPTLFSPNILKSVIAFYPAADVTRDPRLRRPPAAKEDWRPRCSFWTSILREAYGGEFDPRDPRMSPLFIDFTFYPTDMLVVTGDLDGMALEAEELAQKAKSEGTASNRNVILRRMKNCHHGFDKDDVNTDCVQARDEAYELAVKVLKATARTCRWV